MSSFKDTPVVFPARLAGFITRREGVKFLQLKSNPPLPAVPPDKAGRDDWASLYIHIPFCRSLCPFCCFNRYLLDEAKARRYFANLKKEVQMYIDRGFKFSDFYFGGGTPTVLMDELESFIGFLKANFKVKQISLETTHREINAETINALQKMGVNRLSIGVQSFNNDLLKEMGRTVGTGEEAREKLMMAEGHFQTVNADFIFNFPSQTIEQFTADVAAFKQMGIDQATFYPLMPSPHKKTKLERKFSKVETSREKAFYDVILRELFSGGYQASTAWCFSRGQRQIDEYIIDYDDYVGVGAGSVGFLNGDFYVNTFSLEKYDRMINGGQMPIVNWRRLTEREHLRYYMLTKLFGMALDPEKFRQRFRADIHTKLRLELAFFKTFGLVKENGQIAVTPKGMYTLCVMQKEFFAALNTLRERYIEEQL
ncbi:MAG: coproporphyrinogen III oxidase family protein [Dehalococcoidales bacterium]|nr:coproporphyrinogen III oxidase family protein [Dehalococcoidales bacterium]